jgi:hypothetical protein
MEDPLQMMRASTQVTGQVRRFQIATNRTGPHLMKHFGSADWITALISRLRSRVITRTQDLCGTAGRNFTVNLFAVDGPTRFDAYPPEKSVWGIIEKLKNVCATYIYALCARRMNVSSV